MKTSNMLGAVGHCSAVILLVASWMMPQPVKGEQSRVTGYREATFQPGEPRASHPEMCCTLHQHALLAGATPLEDNKPWTAADVISGEDLSKVISASHGVKPSILQVGVQALYNDAHIADSIYAGPAAEPEGLALLKTKANAIVRNKEIVIYCGCCPWQDCPNIKPAFIALRQMGFKKVKLLSIPTDFQQDWVNKGYPTVRS